MSVRHDKATEEMRLCNDQFAATHQEVQDLENYKEMQKFNSIQYEKDLMKKSRLQYGNLESIYNKEIYTSNDAIEQAIVEKRRAELMAHLDELQKITAEKKRDDIERDLKEFKRQQIDKEMAIEGNGVEGDGIDT